MARVVVGGGAAAPGRFRIPHLMNVAKSMLGCSVLTVWLQQLLLNPLKKERIEMAHMDPSEIVQIPYDLRRLTVFVLVPVVFLLFAYMLQRPQKLFTYVVNLFRLSAICYGLLGLCGANIVHNYQHSLYTALYMASLLSTTMKQGDDGPTSGNILEQLPFYGGGESVDMLSQFRLYTMLITNIPFQILQVLDWGIQIQRWPMPVILGVSYGYTFGTLMGILANYFQRQKLISQEEERRRRQ